MIKPFSPRQQTMIANNIVAACKHNIGCLTKQAYNFISGCNGFIAHYNQGGFISHYREVDSLARDILDNKRFNQWSNFRPGERNYEYYMSKRELYNKIVNELEACYA